MPGVGKYIYCIIESSNERNFGPIGIGGRGDNVTTVGYRDLSVVVSNSTMEKYVISRENMMAHEKVVEGVMRDYTVLPVRFCTIATSAEDLRNLLRRRYPEFKNLLRDMDGKVELSLKVLWADMKAIYSEIVAENPGIARLRNKVNRMPGSRSYQGKISLGEKVKDALDKKRDREARTMLKALKGACVDCRENNTFGDSMIMNAAFLVDRFHEKEFDSLVHDLENDMGERVVLSYVGPAPPYNFVNISVEWTQEAV
ncbi:MAG: GvpL/GvpF family gas vesicle protein [Actinobacteria bacterium]|nr:GvpL/GvpF family gas vesicle protein [Actinomycetota bacterium]MBU4403763.1 GvpL/GvpF family gas vesicle protein [Actinomycetota bacterium]MCG2819310.1 GvpL/GvpF family gas vesicle protein [Actinomycetes bacterium]